MHYCQRNFKTKKQLKDAVANYKADPSKFPAILVYNPEVMSGEAETPKNGTVCVGGPHFPQPHTWYATVTLENGEVVKVK